MGYLVDPMERSGLGNEVVLASEEVPLLAVSMFSRNNLVMAHREVAKAINPIRLNLKWWPPF